MKKILLLLLPLLAIFELSHAQEVHYRTLSDIPYSLEDVSSDPYRSSRCKLDIYYPEGKDDFATLIWFHGGGLEGGNKEFPKHLLEQGFAIVAVNYRLSPKVKNPTYTLDAAEATAWVFRNIERYGGDEDKIFISGHSAGGYLALMLTLDKSYLAAYDIDANRFAASFPVSGQTLTHYTIRKERGIDVTLPISDEYAPANCARGDAAPLYLITGDSSLEFMARYEENALLAAVLRDKGQKVWLYQLEGFNHNTVLAPACTMIATLIRQYCQ